MVADAALAGQAAALDPDLLMPRWRRPSLLQARKADPVRDAAPIVPMSFADGGAPTDGVERRTVRYHVVQLLDAPDELRSAAVGTLTQGDEVQLLERSGTYWRVLCPDGQEGWLHRMTLGAAATTAGPEASGEVEAWTMPAEWAGRLRQPDPAPEPEPDLFASFLAARQQGRLDA
jgi:hypothetical protein